MDVVGYFTFRKNSFLKWVAQKNGTVKSLSGIKIRKGNKYIAFSLINYRRKLRSLIIAR